MADVASLSVVISADVSELRKNLNKVQTNLRKAFGGDTIKQSQNLATGFGLVSAALAAMGVASIKASADMEQTRMAFATLLKSGQRANEFLEKMEKFARSTPFDLPGVLNASKQLLAFGFQVQEIEPMLRSLGDASAALGLGDEGIQRLTRALGQMNAAGRVTAQDMNQIIATGISGWQMLANEVGISVAQVRDMVSKGAIDATTGIKAILAGMNQEYGGMMANQEKTLLGMWANIKESLGSTLREIGDQLTQTFNMHERLSYVKIAMDEFARSLKSGGLSVALQTLISPEAITSMYAFAGAMTMAVIPGLTATTLAAIKANVALLPLMAAGIAAGVAFQFLTENGFDAKESLILIASILSVVYIPAIQKFIFTTGVGAVAALKNFVLSLALSVSMAGVATTATNILTIAANSLKLGFIGLLKTIAVFLIPFAKIIIVAALVAAAAIAVYRNWDTIKQSFAGLADYLPSWVTTMVSGIKEVSLSLLEFIGLAKKADIPLNGMGDFKNRDRASDEEIERLRQERTMREAMEKMKSQPMDAGGGSTKGGTDKIAREIDRINEKLSEMKEKAREAGFEFQNFQFNQVYSQLEGANKVFGTVIKEQVDAYLQLDNAVKKFTEMREEAETIHRRAVIAGNAEQIASTKAMLDERVKAELDAADYVAKEKMRVFAETQAEMTKVSTANEAIRAQLQQYQNEANLLGYMEYLTQERVAFLTHMEETKAMMQQYYDWRMEAEQTFLSFQLQAMETLKNGLAESFANAVTAGEDLGKAIQNLGKQIVNMFIQWGVKRMAAAVLSKTLGKQEAAAVSAQGASMAAALAPAAWAKLVVNPGAGAIATTMLTAGMSAAAGIGLGAGIVSSLGGGGEGWKSGAISQNMTDTNFPINASASGGIVTRPTISMIGEGRYHEAILPLNQKNLSKYFPENEGGMTQINYTHNGDIHTERDYQDFLDDIADNLSAGLRSV